MPKTRVAIVGSRNFNNPALITAFVNRLAVKLDAQNLVVVSGGAKGVDSYAEAAARSLGIEVESIKPDWATYGKRAGFLRNTTIVEHADRIVAFHDGISRGTMDTVWKAFDSGKPVVVLNDEGHIVPQDKWPPR